MERRVVEIMAPAGSYESLMTVIQGSAGLVYTLQNFSKKQNELNKNKLKTELENYFRKSMKKGRIFPFC